MLVRGFTPNPDGVIPSNLDHDTSLYVGSRGFVKLSTTYPYPAVISYDAEFVGFILITPPDNNPVNALSSEC